MRSCRNYITTVAFYFSPSLLSLDNSHCWLISTKSVVPLVFATAMLLLLQSFSTGPGYATNCTYVPISCSFVVILVVAVVVFLLIIYIQSDNIYTSTHLYISIIVHLGVRLNVHSCCGVKHVVFSYN